MHRSCMFGLLAGFAAFTSGTQVVGQQSCKPALVFEEVRFSPMKPPTLERKWTARVSVDASRCAVNSTGHFEIVFLRLKETGADLEFREQFTWRPPAVKVEVVFAPDEAVERYWMSNVSSCTCAR
jgi:hypothetical protein